MWASDHDLWEPSFIEEGVRALEADSSAVLWYPQTVIVDQNRNAIDFVDPDYDTRGQSSQVRFHRFVWTDWRIHTPIYGLIVASALRKTHLFQQIFGPDLVCLAELARLGAFIKTPQPLLSMRRQRGSEHLQSHQRRVLKDMDPASREGIRRAYVRHLCRLFVASQQAAGPVERLSQGADVLLFGLRAAMRDLKRTLRLAPEPEPLPG
jgi:hypothetical protein